MDPNGISISGASVAIIAVVAVLMVAVLLLWIIRRSAARMARRNQEWIDQLPISTGSRTETASDAISSPDDTQEALR